MQKHLLLGLVSAWLLANASSAAAQNWAKSLFDHTSFDFGVVDAGAKAEHRFAIKNSYQEDVHITAIRQSCNCAKSSAGKELLKPQEQTEIEVVLDTRSVKGHWEATITVVFDQPFSAEVQFQVKAFVRTDVVVQPTEAKFESVEQGTSASRALMVKRAKCPDWKIVQVKTTCPFLEGSAVEKGRDQGTVTYELQALLKSNAPAGYLREQLVLVTNDIDAHTKEVPVTVEAMIAPAVQMRPSPLSLGLLRPGQSVTKNLVVQGKVPFRVLKATGPDDRFTVQLPNEPKTVQLLAVTFKAEENGGGIGGKIRIETDLEVAPVLEVTVDGQIVSREPAPSADLAPPVASPSSASPGAEGIRTTPAG